MIHRLTVDPQSETWQRAIDRALANGADDKVSHQWTEHSPVFGAESLFLVASNTMDGAVYNVHFVEEDGEQTTSCSCPAGYNGLVCWHQAAALLVAGHLVAPELDDALEAEPVEALKKLGAEGESAKSNERNQRIATAAVGMADVLNGNYRAQLAAGALT